MKRFLAFSKWVAQKVIVHVLARAVDDSNLQLFEAARNSDIICDLNSIAVNFTRRQVANQLSAS
jgi:hypothetical protein